MLHLSNNENSSITSLAIEPWRGTDERVRATNETNDSGGAGDQVGSTSVLKPKTFPGRQPYGKGVSRILLANFNQ